MSNDAIAIIGFVALFVLMLLRVPVGMAMGLVGVTGYSWIVGPGPALKLVGQTSMRTVTDYTFGVIPMFMLMGAFVSVSGVSREMFKAADAFLGHLRGGLGIATVVACGGFAAICGSSVATAATFSAVAYPEMRRFGYPQSFLDRRDRGRRHARRDAAAVDRARGLRDPDPAGHRQALHGRHPARPARDGDVRDDDRASSSRVKPGLLPAGQPKPWPERAGGAEARVGAAGAVRLRDRRPLRRLLHADRGRRRRRERRLHPRRAAPQARTARTSARRCCRPRARRRRCSRC